MATSKRDMIHGRFLFTNHAQLIFDPGFDFLSRRGILGTSVDVASYHSDPGLVHAAHYPLIEAIVSRLRLAYYFSVVGWSGSHGIPNLRLTSSSSTLSGFTSPPTVRRLRRRDGLHQGSIADRGADSTSVEP